MADEATSEIGTVVSRGLLEKFNKTELVAFARLTYGLNVNIDQNAKEDLIELIMNAARQAKGNEEFRVLPKDDAKAEVPKGYVKIKVSAGAHNPKNRPIPVGLNFKMATIPVGKEVIIPGKWMPCLEDAVQRKYSVGYDESTGRETLVWNDQHAYPFTILVDNR